MCVCVCVLTSPKTKADLSRCSPKKPVLKAAAKCRLAVWHKQFPSMALWNWPNLHQTGCWNDRFCPGWWEIQVSAERLKFWAQIWGEERRRRWKVRLHSSTEVQLSNLSLLLKYADNIVVTLQECSAKDSLFLWTESRKFGRDKWTVSLFILCRDVNLCYRMECWKTHWCVLQTLQSLGH